MFFLNYAHIRQISFQNPASPLFEGIINLHHNIFFYLLIILCLVLTISHIIYLRTSVFWERPRYVSLSRFRKFYFSLTNLNHGTFLELFWTIVPTLILLVIVLPSFALLYSIDEVIYPTITIKVIGHQWYWTYEFEQAKINNHIGLINSWASSVSIIKSKISLCDLVMQIGPLDKTVRWVIDREVLDKDLWTALTFRQDDEGLRDWAEKNVPETEWLIKRAIANDPVYYEKFNKWINENEVLINTRMLNKWLFATEYIDNKFIVNKDKVREWITNNPIDKVSEFDYKYSRFEYEFNFWFNSFLKLDADANFNDWLHESASQLKTMEAIKRLLLFTYCVKPEEALIGVLLEHYGKMCDLVSSIVEFNSYIRPVSSLELGDLRLLEVDHPLVCPINTHLRFLVTSTDVIHSWAVPALGVKVDCVPGRLNQAMIFINRPGVYYGQCSELCGIGHAFMPIQIIGV